MTQALEAIWRGVVGDLRDALGDAAWNVTPEAVYFRDSPALDLAPLRAYVAEHAEGATIPNTFGRSVVPLRELYVDIGVCTVDDAYEAQLRALAAGGDWVESHRRRIEVRTRQRITIPHLLHDPRSHVRVLFGDPGSGKSTLFHYLRHAICRRAYVEFSVAFLVPLRQYAHATARGADLLAYVVEHSLRVREPVQQQLWASTLGYLARNRKGVAFLLDGLDEVTDAAARAFVGNAVRQLAFGFTVLVSSRRAGFYSDIGACRWFELIDLSDSSAKALVRNWFTNVHPRDAAFTRAFIDWLFSSPVVRSLARNPCLLSLLCYLNQAVPSDALRAGRNRAELYAEAFRVLRLDYERTYDRPYPPTASSTLAHFAYELFGAGEVVAPKHFFTRDDFATFAAAHAPGGDTLVAEVWLKMKLLSQWDDRGVLHFIHLTFAEWFVARRLLALPHAELRAVIERQKFNPFWKEVWRFFAGECALLGETEGRQRFAALAESVLADRDLFDQVLFWAAPLFAEFGLRDTRDLLGYDLRRELFDAAYRMPVEQDAFFRIVGEFDPAFFLAAAIAEVNAGLHRLGASPLPAVPPPAPALPFPARSGDPTEPLTHAIRLVGAIPLHAAGQLLLALTERRGQRLAAVRAVAAGALAQHSTEAVRTDLVGQFEQATAVPRKEHLLGSLALVADTDVADSIYREAAAAASAPFRVAALGVLAGMDDPRAIDLARTLWHDGTLRRRRDLLDEVLLALPEVHDLAVDRELRAWDADVRLPQLRERLLAARLSVAVWDNDAGLLALTRHPDGELRRTAWHLFVRRERAESAPWVATALHDHRTSDEDRVDLLDLVGEQRLHACRATAEEIVSDAHGRAEDVVAAAWIAYTRLVSSPGDADAGAFRTRVLPAFLAAVREGAEPSTIERWLGAILSGDVVVWEALWAALQTEVRRLPPRVKEAALVALSQRSARGVARWIEEELGDASLGPSAAAALVRNDPAAALARVDVPHVARELRRRSIEEDVLFYPTTYRDRFGQLQPYVENVLTSDGVTFRIEPAGPDVVTQSRARIE